MYFDAMGSGEFYLCRNVAEGWVKIDVSVPP